MTKRLREWAAEEQQELMNVWSSGGFMASFEAEAIARNAGATGACSVYKQLIELDYDLINGDSNE